MNVKRVDDSVFSSPAWDEKREGHEVHNHGRTTGLGPYEYPVRPDHDCDACMGTGTCYRSDDIYDTCMHCMDTLERPEALAWRSVQTAMQFMEETRRQGDAA